VPGDARLLPAGLRSARLSGSPNRRGAAMGCFHSTAKRQHPGYEDPVHLASQTACEFVAPTYSRTSSPFSSQCLHGRIDGLKYQLFMSILNTTAGPSRVLLIWKNLYPI
jgi:hypothetical protein